MPSTTGLWRTMGPTICAAAIVIGGGLVYGQTTSQKPQSNAQTSRPAGTMMVDEGQAGAMMAQRQQMMARMRTLDQKLADLVAKMDAARGTKKVDAIAAVVKGLATERSQMRDDMMAMQSRMMGHMMQHMMSMQGNMMGTMNRGGGQAGATPSMENCPMMKGLAQEEANDHAAHHPDDKK